MTTDFLIPQLHHCRESQVNQDWIDDIQRKWNISASRIAITQIIDLLENWKIKANKALN